MESDDLRKIPLFFIFGRPRSGTTLLTTLFNAHPNVKIAPELPIMIFLYQKFKNVKVWDEKTIISFIDSAFYYAKYSPKRIEQLKIDKDFIIKELLKYSGENASIQVFLKSINYYAFSLYHKEETKWIGDKNPVYTIFANRLRDIFPDSKFICIVRDYRDNFISIKKLVEKEVAIEAPNMSLQAGRWKWVIKRFLKLKEKYPDKYFIVRYEDLVTEKEKTFRELCDFLGLEYDPSVFDYYKRADDTLKTYGSQTWERFHENLLKPVNTESINTWPSKLTSQQVRLADQIAGKYADKLGYERKYRDFNFLLWLKSLPMSLYNTILLQIMIFGTYLPYKLSQWWFFKSLIFLRAYLFLFGKKSVYRKSVR